MTVRARDVAAELRRRVAPLPAKKLHKLLYYCQGHHLAATGSPLFSDRVSAWDMGPVVGSLWKEEQEESRGESASAPVLDESHLNTIGYVTSRYGALSGRDLEVLSHGEPPWQRANQDRRPGDSVRIRDEWMRQYFGSDVEEDVVVLDSGEVRSWLAGAVARRGDEVVPPDDLHELRQRLTRRA